ncbi:MULTISPECIES: phage major capsid protein [Paracoccus]|uniref:Phage major capsid protein, HK97 family n=1 Tax=Paracoccus denitrificans (strain Pd 1222) TaxID=318586 RepID=A1B638_PARDP|nr:MULTISPECIES: phage major capsid protein [Paracoccus]ABL70982.1 phage major capsid protein, HK97 family [Paracoccus denitrificans PD1222]MBB4626637.1 HK97 family phage major capsid protein [Paracoccus denitrificans]MCU7428720.1 phage major capsid protein [Paracoccus denitrificans]MDK8872855.1 phage major capsid protein [Paracoccus sp. SSJ]QAR27657.1 phage major capsid protein [Paracoccus denitrificans]
MTEVKAAAGADVPGDLGAEMLGFVQELKAFRSEIQNRLEAQEERMTMLDRKTISRPRAPLSVEADQGAPHQKAFDAYIRHGDDGALRGLPLEGKAMTSTSDGGFLAAPTVAMQVQEALNVTASLRRVANVVAVESASYEVLVDMGDIAHGWASEAAAQAETGTPSVQRVVIPVHELSAMPKASQRLLDDAAFDVETWLAGRIAEKFARAEATAFISGDGVNKPRGILTHAKAPNGSATNVQIGTIPSGGTGDFAATNPANALIDLVYALGAQYRANASFVMNSKTAAAVRKMRDADGRFLWADSLAMGQPAQLLGYPVLVCEDMPDIAQGSHSIAFGDFRSAYTIVERPDLRVLRDPFSAKPHVLFYASKRVGGGVTDARAVKLMVFG